MHPVTHMDELSKKKGIRDAKTAGAAGNIVCWTKFLHEKKKWRSNR